MDVSRTPSVEPPHGAKTMRVWTLLALLMASGTTLAYGQDPVEVAADHYSVVFENDEVRVLKIHYGPGETAVMHDHPAGVAVFLSDAEIHFTAPDGSSAHVTGAAGDAVWAAAGPHAVENMGESIDAILIELKDDDAEDDD
jgi:quercetin dioxygenase-like cupin family protein